MGELSSKKNRDYIADAFLQYLKYWRWFLCITFSFVILAVVYIKIKRPVYSLTASVVIKKEDQKATSMMATAMMKSFGMGMSGMLASESTEDEIQVFGSQNIIRRMVASLGIHTSYELSKFPSNLSLYKNSPIEIKADSCFIDTLTIPFTFKIKAELNEIKVSVKRNKTTLGEYKFKALPAEIKTPYGVFRIQENNAVEIPKPYSLKATLKGLDQTAEDIKENIDIATITKKSDVISLSIDDEIRQRGKDILNEIIKQYNINALFDKDKTALNTTQFLKIRIDSLSEELRLIETNIESYKRANKFVDAGAEVGITLGKISQLQEKNSTLNIQSAMIKAIEKQTKANNYELLPTSIGVPENVASIVSKYNETILYRMRILRNSNEESPIVQTIDEQLKSLKSNLLSSLQNAQKDIGISKEDSRQVESEINSRINQMPRMERDYVSLKRQQELKSQIYLFLLQKMEETRLTKASLEPKAKIVDAAYSLTKPVRPKKIILLAVAILFGIFVSVVLICYKVLTNKRIVTLGELDSLLNGEVLGCITTQSPINDWKRLRTTILQEIQQKREKVLLVSSVEATKTKSSFVISLSENIAKTGYKTVLIDLDLTPSNDILGRVKLSTQKGISEYICDISVSEQEIIHPMQTNSNIDFISAGNRTEALDMFVNGRVSKLVESLSTKYDIVILSLPSFQEVSDSLLLSYLSKLSLYVVEIGKTSKKSISELNQQTLGTEENIYAVAYEA